MFHIIICSVDISALLISNDERFFSLILAAFTVF